MFQVNAINFDPKKQKEQNSSIMDERSMIWQWKKWGPCHEVQTPRWRALQELKLRDEVRATEMKFRDEGHATEQYFGEDLFANQD